MDSLGPGLFGLLLGSQLLPHRCLIARGDLYFFMSRLDDQSLLDVFFLFVGERWLYFNAVVNSRLGATPVRTEG